MDFVISHLHKFSYKLVFKSSHLLSLLPWSPGAGFIEHRRNFVHISIVRLITRSAQGYNVGGRSNNLRHKSNRKSCPTNISACSSYLKQMSSKRKSHRTGIKVDSSYIKLAGGIWNPSEKHFPLPQATSVWYVATRLPNTVEHGLA